MVGKGSKCSFQLVFNVLSFSVKRQHPVLSHSLLPAKPSGSPQPLGCSWKPSAPCPFIKTSAVWHKSDLLGDKPEPAAVRLLQQEGVVLDEPFQKC